MGNLTGLTGFDYHPLLHAIEQHVLKSLPEYSIILGLFSVAVIANMIPPRAIRSWLMDPGSLWMKFKEALALSYEWFYNSMQAFMAARHPQPPASVATTVTTPAGTATQVAVSGSDTAAVPTAVPSLPPASPASPMPPVVPTAPPVVPPPPPLSTEPPTEPADPAKETP